jgi:hypothetical protein
MSDFVFKANITRYKALLVIETDARKVATLRELLAEEEANQAEFHTKRLRPNVAE